VSGLGRRAGSLRVSPLWLIVSLARLTQIAMRDVESGESGVLPLTQPAELTRPDVEPPVADRVTVLTLRELADSASAKRSTAAAALAAAELELVNVREKAERVRVEVERVWTDVQRLNQELEGAVRKQEEYVGKVDEERRERAVWVSWAAEG
jgi:hypothetical protein